MIWARRRTGEPPVARKGDQLPIAPDFKGHLRGRLEFALGRYTAHLQASAVHQGDRYGYLDHDARKNLPARWSTSARGWRASAGRPGCSR